MTSPQTRESSNPESVFLAALPAIDRAVRYLARRYALAEADAEDFGSWVRAKLIGDGYRVFREFQGRSSLQTYLATVVANLFRDYRNSRWGRWRPSAIARRLGPIAIRFEALVHRDGYGPREATEVLRSSGIPTADIKGLAEQIPLRTRVREVTLEVAVETAPAADRADAAVDAGERGANASEAENAVRAALAELSAEDQVIVRMRFWDDFSVAEIARTLQIDQKRLYRRLEAIQGSLAGRLVARGVTQQRVAELLMQEAR